VVGLLLPSAIALIAALALRPLAADKPRLRFAWWGVIIATFGFELLLYNPPINTMAWALVLGPWLWVVTKLIMLLCLGRNARPSGQWSIACLVMALGIALNTVAIVANGGYMPQSVEAAKTVWGAHAERSGVDTTRLRNTRPMDADSQLTWLADVIVQPDWLPRRNVISIGDVLLSLGMAVWIFGGLQKVVPTGPDRDPRSRANLKLFEDVLDVRLDGLDRHHQRLADRPI